MGAGSSSLKSVHAEQGRSITVVWKNGAETTLDLGDHIKSYAIFKPLQKGDALFKKVRLGEWGWSVHWSDDMEIPSDLLWQLALEQGSAWLRTWRDAHKMTQAEAAKALGVSARMWRYYEAGTHLLPKTVRLACAGFDVQAQAA
jgi:hypothetical protein